MPFEFLQNEKLVAVLYIRLISRITSIVDDEDCIGSVSREPSFKLQGVHLESQLKMLETLQGASDTYMPY